MKARRKVSQWVRNLVWGGLGLVSFGLPISLGIWWCFPGVDFNAWERGPPPGPWAHQREQARVAVERHTPVRIRFSYVPASAIATDVKLAMVVAEDAGFFSHGPIDFDAIQEALQQWVGGRRLRGASTITQQLAKNLFLSSERSWRRKINEMRLAWWLERRLSKNRILELYVNVVELGPGIYGVDAASRYYFDVTAGELNHEQAVNLAAAIPAPLLSNPRTRTSGWMRRRDAIEERMTRMSHLRTVLEQQAKRDLRAEG